MSKWPEHLGRSALHLFAHEARVRNPIAVVPLVSCLDIHTDTSRPRRALLLPFEVWPMLSMSRRMINCANLCLSLTFGQIMWIRKLAVNRDSVLSSTTSAKFGKTAVYKGKPRRVGILRGDGSVECGMQMDHKSYTVCAGDLQSPEISLLLKRGQYYFTRYAAVDSVALGT